MQGRFGNIVFSLLAAVCLLVMAGCSGDMFRDWFFSADYKIAGLEENADLHKTIGDILDDHAAAIKPQKDPDDRKAQESYEADRLKTTVEAAMQAQGYYDAVVTFTDGAEEFQGTYNIDAGAVYKINRIRIRQKKFRQHADVIAIKSGDALVAENVLTAQAALYRAIAAGRCYFTLDVDHEVVLDPRKKTADIAFVVDAGVETKFGTTTFKGNDTVRTSYLAKRLPWKEGDCFDRAKIDTMRAALFESGLFSRADIILPDKPSRGKVDVDIDVMERAHRTVSLGLSYYSDEGAGLQAGWQHRNFFGAAEKFEARLNLSTVLQSLRSTLTVPYFIRNDQTLSVNLGVKREDSDAYLEVGLDGGASIRRRFSRHVSGSTGAAFSITQIKDHATFTTRTFGLVSFPHNVTYDSRNNQLDPVRGWLLEASVEPFIDAFGEASPFVKTIIGARTYIGMGDTFTLALRARMGSIMGAGATDIPANKRFYAGGGGSVRGFGYQDVGPRNNANDPAGGRSLVETSVEARFRVGENFGLVGFVDAGNVHQDVTPQFSDMSVGAGVGIRYYTGFGPLRLDVAMPIEGKRTGDSAFQVYMSIGQAF